MKPSPGDRCDKCGAVKFWEVSAMTDVATALKWAREFGPNSPAQVLADALETAERHGDEWQEKGLELYGELYAALAEMEQLRVDLANRNDFLHDAAANAMAFMRQRDDALAALRKYGRHENECPVCNYHELYGKTPECNCGLHAALLESDSKEDVND